MKSAAKIALRLMGVLQNVLPALFLISIMLAFGSYGMCVISVLCAAVHEIGHIAALMILGAYSKCVRADASGLRLTPSRLLSYREEIFVALAGPLANLLFAAVLMLLSLFIGASGYLRLIALVSIITMLSNLLPVRSYDGYKALHALISQSCTKSHALRALEWVSLCLCALMTYLSLYLMLVLGEGYWIFAIFTFDMLSQMRMLRK